MSKGQRKVEWSLDLENMRVRAGQFVSDMMGSTAEAKSASLREARDCARSARVDIGFSVGRASVNALPADSQDLFQAELRTVVDYEYSVSGLDERGISLRQKRSFARDLTAAAGNREDLYWDIALARNVPLKLKLRGGMGDGVFDLSYLSVNTFKLQTGVGTVALTMPLKARDLLADVKGGVGTTEVTIPAGCGVNLTIAGGVGALRVLAAAGAAIRLSGRSGLGRIDLADGFELKEDSSAQMGRVWATPGFADAANRIEVDYKGGVGSFSLETIDIL